MEQLTWIPRSSDAFNSSTLLFIKSALREREITQRTHWLITYPYSSLATANIADVFPVPGGP